MATPRAQISDWSYENLIDKFDEQLAHGWVMLVSSFTYARERSLGLVSLKNNGKQCVWTKVDSVGLLLKR